MRFFFFKEDEKNIMDRLKEEKKTEAALAEPDENRKLIREIARRQSRLFGHVFSRNKLEYLVTTGKSGGEKADGRLGDKTRMPCLQ